MIKRYSTYVNETEDTFNYTAPVHISNEQINDNETINHHKETEVKKDNTNDTITYPSKSKQFKYCNLCNQKIFSIEGYNNHLQSKKHIKRIKRSTYDEIHIAGSIKKYLINKRMIKDPKRSPVSRARYHLYSHLLNKMYKHLPPN